MMMKRQKHDELGKRRARLGARLDALAEGEASFAALAPELRALTRRREQKPAEVLLREAREGR
jgi:hypothetical protein